MTTQQPPQNIITLKGKKPRKPGKIRLPNAPKTLNAEAKVWWKSLLFQYEIDDSAGLLLLTLALESFTRMRQAQALIAEEGITTIDKYGQHRAHPATTIERDSRTQMLASFRALNLDVEAPGKVGRPAKR